jgi:hypothetical protein
MKKALFKFAYVKVAERSALVVDGIEEVRKLSSKVDLFNNWISSFLAGTGSVLRNYLAMVGMPTSSGKCSRSILLMSTSSSSKSP